MKKNKLRIIVSLLLLIAILSFAQKITIQEAAEMAIKNNKDIKIGMLKAVQGEINVDKAWASKFFTDSYSGSAQEHLK